MAKVTLNPAVPAVTKVITEAQPASITLMLTLDEAARVRAVLGQCCGTCETYGLFTQLAEVVNSAPTCPFYVVSNLSSIPAIKLQKVR